MVEFAQKVDYSMPRQCGIFPPPPIEYKNVRALGIILQCELNAKKKFLPPELEPIKNGIDGLFILEYPDTTIGSYNEMLIGLNCKYKGKPGSFVCNIYVDDDVALTAGREIYGFPKKMCEIKLSPIHENRIRGTLTRKGITFIDVEVQVAELPKGMDPKSILESMPIYNLKLIPDIADSSKPALRQITETNMKYGKFYKTLGVKVNYLKSEYSQFDICHEVLKDANKNIGGFYIEYDFTLPNGRVLE